MEPPLCDPIQKEKRGEKKIKKRTKKAIIRERKENKEDLAKV